MQTLSKTQVKTILDQAPAGADKSAILDGLVQRGYTLEGVSTQKAMERIQAKEASKQEKVASIFSSGGTNLQDTIDQYSVNAPQSVETRRSDIIPDIKETGARIKDTFNQRTDRIGTRIARADEDGQRTFRENASIGASWGTSTALTFLDVLGEAAIGAVKVALTPQQEEKISNAFTSTVQTVDENTRGSAGRKAVSEIVGAWNEFEKKNPDLAYDLVTATDFAQVMAEIVGAKFGVRATEETFDTAGRVIKETSPIIKQKMDDSVKVAGRVVDNVNAGRVDKQADLAKTATGRILQGKPEDVDTGLRALSNIDTKDVKTYKELNTKIDDELTNVRTELDTYLEDYDTKFTRQQLGKFDDVDGKTVASTPVIDAIDQLRAFYEKTGRSADVERMNQLLAKVDSEGITVKELNDLARLHGRELNAYNASGELASGLNKQAAENTRQGLKTVVRDRLPDDTARDLDAQMSDLLDTQNLTKKMEDKVNQLQQKIKNRSLGAKVGATIFDTLDMLTFGSARGFIQKGFPSNVGQKTANSLDLEEELAKNLKEIDRLLKIKNKAKFEEAVQKYFDDLQPGLSTKVTSGLTEPEKDQMLSELFSLNSRSFNVDNEVSLELFDRVEYLKKRAEQARGLTEAEYVELRQLLDELN